MSIAKHLLSDIDRKKISEAIKSAEKETSGEIRLFVESRCKGEILDRAAYVFKTLEMHKTKERNGVLFYLAKEDKKFAIIGDKGINAKVAATFWDSTKELIIEQFKQNNFGEGLSKGIELAGKSLQKFFPYDEKTDTNELSNEIVFGQ